MDSKQLASIKNIGCVDAQDQIMFLDPKKRFPTFVLNNRSNATETEQMVFIPYKERDRRGNVDIAEL